MSKASYRKLHHLSGFLFRTLKNQSRLFFIEEKSLLKFSFGKPQRITLKRGTSVKNIWLHTAYWRGMLNPCVVLVVPIAAVLAATVVSGKSRNMLHASLILFALHTLFKYVWVEAFSWVYPHGFTWARDLAKPPQFSEGEPGR